MSPVFVSIFASFLKQHEFVVTCMTASDQPDSEKSPHPFCLSDNPTFSVKETERDDERI